MTSSRRAWHAATTILLALAGLCSVSGQTLEDFGYQRMKRDGDVLAEGEHPLLLVIASFAGEPALLHDIPHYTDMVYDLSGANESLNGYVYENSNQSFWWTPPSPANHVYLSLGSDETLDAWKAHMEVNGLTNTVFKHRWYAYAWFSNITQRVMDGGFDFAPFDANTNGNISTGELPILVLSNDPGSPGLTRTTGWAVSTPGSSVTVHTMTTAAMEQNGNDIGFNVFCHEAIHLLGTRDLYDPTGTCWLCANLSLYGDHIVATRPHGVYHMDPWHKLRLGWIEPEIRAMDTVGSLTLVPPQSAVRDGVLLLHHPHRGSDEFFLVEYRANDTSYGPGYDEFVAGNGVVIWQAWHPDGWSMGQYAVSCDCAGDTNCPSVFSVGAPDMNHGGHAVWGSGQKTQQFSWIDPAAEPHWVPCTLSVGAFSPGANSVQVSWNGTPYVWVDFAHSGTEIGTFSAPFNTLAEGVAAVPVGGVVAVKAGTSSETPTITKKLVIESYGGSAIVGQ